MKLSSRRFIIISVTVIATFAVFMIVRTFSSSISASTPESSADPISAQSTQSAQSAQSMQSASALSSAQSAPLAPAEAATVIDEVIADASNALQAPQSGTPAPDPASYTGVALEELVGQYDEWARIGLRQEGTPTIENPTVISSTPEGDRVVIQACVDSSNVRVYNEAGIDLRVQEEKRALTHFTLVKVDGKWKLEDEDFADDPDC